MVWHFIRFNVRIYSGMSSLGLMATNLASALNPMAFALPLKALALI